MQTNFISEQYTAITRDLDRLAKLIQRLPHRDARVAAITPTAKGSESEPTTSIVVLEQTGSDALALAADCYRDLHIIPQLSQKSARRTVGVLWLSPSQIGAAATDELRQLVDRINTAKAGIETFIVSSYGTRQERFEALRAECPGVMTLHLYRQIRCYAEGDVNSIRFTWQQKDSLKRPDKDELMRRIRVELEKAGPDFRPPLEDLLDKISGTPEAALRERREVKVQPVANIMAAGALRTVTAPMPLILLQDADAKIKMLKSFDPKAGRKTRNDRVESRAIGTFCGVAIEAFPL